jgi:hypothetical protein
LYLVLTAALCTAKRTALIVQRSESVHPSQDVSSEQQALYAASSDLIVK